MSLLSVNTSDMEQVAFRLSLESCHLVTAPNSLTRVVRPSLRHLSASERFTVKTLFYRCCILISRFSYVENSLHFRRIFIIKIPLVLPFIKNIAYHITELLLFYADKLMVMGNSKNLHVFYLAILLKLRKSWKFDAHKIYMFYISYLHWLTVHYRIHFRIASLTYKTLATCQPSCLYILLQVHQPSRALRSSTQKLLQVPYLSTDFGRLAFSYSSPVTWYSVPTSIINCSFLYSFKRHLKSHLIAQLINNTYSVWPPGDCPLLWFMTDDCVHVINCIIISVISVKQSFNRLNWYRPKQQIIFRLCVLQYRKTCLPLFISFLGKHTLSISCLLYTSPSPRD